MSLTIWVAGVPLKMLKPLLNFELKTLTPNPTRLFFFIPSAPMSSSSSPAAKVVAEYAKSGRSSCKKCSKTIAASALRLGLVSKDPRGFDMTKWHHLSCVPFGVSGPLSSADAITGFSSLKVGISILPLAFRFVNCVHANDKKLK